MMMNQFQNKIQSWENARSLVRKWQEAGDSVVFTNGCFDLLHFGHLYLLSTARDLGGRLVVGLNGSDSIRRLKGPGRPIQDDLSRQLLLAGFECVDLVVVFEQDTPLELIKKLQPNILVKGGDWKKEEIVGAKEVLSWGGTVESIAYQRGYSTTNLETKINQQSNE